MEFPTKMMIFHFIRTICFLSFTLQLNITENHFLENVLAVLKYDAYHNLEKLRKPVDKDKWSTEPAVVNAFYNPNKNDIGNHSEFTSRT